jgi:DNA-directed RNA polymerase subunit RPC12/RpoP
MVDKPRRPILHLKSAPKLPITPDFTPPSRAKAKVVVPEAKPKASDKAPEWKCKPCGKGFDVAAELADDDAVRCPACNARLGLAKDFRSDPPNLAKVRARPTAKGAPTPPPAGA